MRKERKHDTAAQKMAILREHFIEKVPISQVCARHQLQPTLFYTGQKTLFENGAALLRLATGPSSGSGTPKPAGWRPWRPS